jgi:hypothetical protein
MPDRRPPTDGTEDHGPFRSDSPDPWPLTDQEQAVAGCLAALFHQRVVLVTAQALTEAGVPLDPEWPGDQALLAVLLLLPTVGYEIPWDGCCGPDSARKDGDRVADLTFPGTEPG